MNQGNGGRRRREGGGGLVGIQLSVHEPPLFENGEVQEQLPVHVLCYTGMGLLRLARGGAPRSLPLSRHDYPSTASAR